MYAESLRLFLPSFMITYLGIVFIWEIARRLNKRQISSVAYNDLRLVKQISTTDLWFKLFLIVVAAMGILYSFFPRLYQIFIPIEPLDHPIINGIGILILKVALVWLVVAQVFIDKELFKLHQKITDEKTAKLLYHSEKALLSGLMLLFIGFFVTLSSVFALILCIIAYLLYKNYIKNIGSAITKLL